MRKSQIAIGLSPTDYKELEALGNSVIAALTGNASFLTPAITLTDLQTAVDSVSAALSLWKPDGSYGGFAELADLQTKSLTLWGLLRAEADYVQTESQILAGSDFSALRSIMSTSGYNLKRLPSLQGVLEAVTNFHRFISRSLAANLIKLKWSVPLNLTSHSNVRSYRVFRGMTNVFSSAVEIGATTKTTFIDTNLTGVVQTYYYWIVAVGAAGNGAPSEALLVMVLPI